MDCQILFIVLSVMVKYSFRLFMADAASVLGFVLACIHMDDLYVMGLYAFLMNLALSHSIGIRLYRRNLYTEALDERQGEMGRH